MKTIILASKSPRRKELLGRFLDDIIIRCDDSDEVRVVGEKPYDMVCRLASEKVRSVSEKSTENALVIGADTVVVLDSEILGKPKNEKDAENMLKSLSGREHSVFTGVSVMDRDSGKIVSEFEETKVRFKELSHEEISAYIKSGEPMDKAGAYGIQDLGALFVEGVDGDYFNVVGLPLHRLNKILKENFSLDLLKPRGIERHKA